MKIIFEDGSDRNENENISSGKFEFEDVSSVSTDENKPKKPVRPVRRPAPTLRPAPTQKAEAEAPAQPPQAQQPYAQMPYMQYPQGYPVYPPQGYMTPEQAAAFGQQYPQGYPAYPPVQGGYMQGQFVPYQQPVHNQPSLGAEQNPGMRVLYQSPDFDRQERSSDSPVYRGTGTQTGIVHEDVDFADEAVPVGKLKKTEAKRPVSRLSRSFNEDEVEMSLFELNAMGNRYQPTVKTVRQPKSKDQVFDVEELEDGNEEEYTDEDEVLEPIDGEEKKKLPVSEIIRRVVLAVAIVAIIVSAGMLLNEWRLSKENDDLVEDVSGLIIDVDEEEPTTKPSEDEEDKTTEKDEDGEEDKTTTEAELTPAQQWAQLQAEYPDVIFPANLQLKYAKLYATNQDFVGYLTADGVNLNLPIVQAEDDEEYMDKNFYGKTTKYGCPFVTHLNNITELDTNTVIFGHHMNNGTVFGALDEYKTIEGFRKAPVITFNTLYKDYQWKVIAAFITNAYEEQDNGYIFRYYFTSLSTEERYSAFLNELSQRTLYDTGVDVLPTDKILTLSTCSHEFEEARFVVVARLVRNGETAEVDVSKAAVNPNPRYPQAYYDKKGIENPFEKASRWEVG